MKGYYNVTILPTAEKKLRKLSKPIRTRIVDRISALTTDPRPSGVKKLKGRSAYRIRIGSYRVVYEIIDKALIVNVIAVGDRKDIYK